MTKVCTYITILSASIITTTIIIHKFLTTNQTHACSMYGIPEQMNQIVLLAKTGQNGYLQCILTVAGQDFHLQEGFFFSGQRLHWF